MPNLSQKLVAQAAFARSRVLSESAKHPVLSDIFPQADNDAARYFFLRTEDLHVHELQKAFRRAHKMIADPGEELRALCYTREDIHRGPCIRLAEYFEHLGPVHVWTRFYLQAETSLSDNHTAVHGRVEAIILSAGYRPIATQHYNRLLQRREMKAVDGTPSPLFIKLTQSFPELGKGYKIDIECPHLQMPDASQLVDHHQAKETLIRAAKDDRQAPPTGLRAVDDIAAQARSQLRHGVQDFDIEVTEMSRSRNSWRVFVDLGEFARTAKRADHWERLQFLFQESHSIATQIASGMLETVPPNGRSQRFRGGFCGPLAEKAMFYRIAERKIGRLLG